MHSTRVAAVCYLLQVGLSELIIKILTNWSSDQIRRYIERLELDPELVRPWVYYNPNAIAGSYTIK